MNVKEKLNNLLDGDDFHGRTEHYEHIIKELKLIVNFINYEPLQYDDTFEPVIYLSLEDIIGVIAVDNELNSDNETLRYLVKKHFSDKLKLVAEELCDAFMQEYHETFSEVMSSKFGDEVELVLKEYLDIEK